MTDIHDWTQAIRKEKITCREAPDATSYYCMHRLKDMAEHQIEYIVIPTNEYQLGNLLGLLKRSTDKNTGDWWYEYVDIIIETMRKLAIEKLISNWVDTFTLESLKNGDWLKQGEQSQ